MSPILAETKISELAIPYRNMVLEEAFSIAVWQSGHANLPGHVRTVADLAGYCQQELGKVLERLNSIIRLSQCTELQPQALENMLQSSKELILLDVRDDNAFQKDNISGSISISSIFLPEQFPKWQSQQLAVVVIAQDSPRAYSACLYLKENGLTSAYYLAGGFQGWKEYQAQQSR